MDVIRFSDVYLQKGRNVSNNEYNYILIPKDE